jgi:hypothetical protein
MCLTADRYRRPGWAVVLLGGGLLAGLALPLAPGARRVGVGLFADLAHQLRQAVLLLLGHLGMAVS